MHQWCCSLGRKARPVEYQLLSPRPLYLHSYSWLFDGTFSGLRTPLVAFWVEWSISLKKAEGEPWLQVILHKVSSRKRGASEVWTEIGPMGKWPFVLDWRHRFPCLWLEVAFWFSEGAGPVEEFAAYSVGILMEWSLRAPFSAEIWLGHLDKKHRPGIRAVLWWRLTTGCCYTPGFGCQYWVPDNCT